MLQPVGIDKMGVYVPKYYVNLTELAERRGVDPNKWTIGIGQEKMAVPTLVEDVVAMAANATLMILDDDDRQTIDQVIVATESGIDFSKAISTYVHELLNIQPFARAYEMKQACYSGTSGLLAACDYVRLRPERKVLVITVDIARYGLNTGGEVTQGAGAIAMLVSANPRVMTIELDTVSYTTNQFDFWRPNYSDVAFVDGKFSTQLYQDCFTNVLQECERRDENILSQLRTVICHVPFTKMGKKALQYYADKVDRTSRVDEWLKDYEASVRLGRIVGNIYTGSLYLSLISLLMYSDKSLVGETIGLFSYGSGAVSELFVGTVQPHYLEGVKTDVIEAHLDRRVPLTVDEYEKIFNEKIIPTDDVMTFEPLDDEQGIYLAKVDAHRRYYELQKK